MRWKRKDAVYGDMVRVKIREIYHYGIYVSEADVIQFGPTPAERIALRDSEIEVISTNVEAFLAGGFLEVAEFDAEEQKKNRSPEETVAFAKQRLGTKGYHIIYNNCEHFANECISGVASCSQTDRVRALFRSLPLADVYVAKIPEEGSIGHVLPEERAREIERISNERVRREKYYAWCLLEYALERSLGLKLSEMQITRSEHGKWLSPQCEFSLSHSASAVAVAVSRAPIGVDVERLARKHPAGMAERILTAEELSELQTIAESEREAYLTEKWSGKEALFKREGGKSFQASAWNTHTAELSCRRVTLAGEEYVLSVATATPEKIKLFEEVDLTRFVSKM